MFSLINEPMLVYEWKESFLCSVTFHGEIVRSFYWFSLFWWFAAVAVVLHFCLWPIYFIAVISWHKKKMMKPIGSNDEFKWTTRYVFKIRGKQEDESICKNMILLSQSWYCGCRSLWLRTVGWNVEISGRIWYYIFPSLACLRISISKS